MNLRCLVYMNPLTVDKIRKSFILEKDSGYLYLRQLLYSLPREWRFTILVPKNTDPRLFYNKHRNIDLVEYDYSTSIHQNRYHFNRNIIAKALPYGVDIDVVLNMQPEVAANLKVFFENQRREHPIIVNYFHWIDCKESRHSGEKFITRQVEGFNAADRNMFHSKEAIDMFVESAEDERLPISPTPDHGLFHPLPTKYGNEDMELPDKKIILFNHRLNNSTGYHQVFDAIFSLKRDDFVLWITDEANLKEYYLKEHSNVIMKTVPFGQYGTLLKKAHFSICNLQEYATWNMAVLDSIEAGTPVLSNTTPLMATLGAIQCKDWIAGINRLLDDKKHFPASHITKDYDLEPYLVNAVKTRVYASTPKKFDDVYDLIKSQYSTEKREFVNKFWSFHANSNFQKIRWRLLQTCITDDTTKKLTTYNNGV